MSVNEKMTAIADAIREKTGGTEALTLDAMATAIAGIETGGGEYSAEYITSIMDRSVQNLVIPEGMTKLGYYTFAGCKQLESVQFPDSLLELGDNCFYVAASPAMLDVELPPQLVTINGGSFYGAKNLRVSTIPDTVSTIGGNAFRESACAVSVIPAGVKEIDMNAFHKSGITSITFLGTPDKIESNSFSNNTSLKTINAPWAEGEVANAPWGATSATINYNYIEE